MNTTVKFKFFIFYVLFVMVFTLSGCSKDNGKEVPSDMERIEAKDFNTVKPKSWLQDIKISGDPDEIGFRPKDKQTNIFVTNYLNYVGLAEQQHSA